MEPIKVVWTTTEDIPAGSTVTVEFVAPDSKPKPAPEPAPDPPVRQMPKVMESTKLYDNSKWNFRRVDFPTEVYARNKWHQFFLAHKAGRRDLFRLGPEDSEPVLVQEDVQHVQARTFNEGTVAELKIIVPGFKTLCGRSQYPFRDLNFLSDIPPHVGPYKHGDAISIADGSSPILKANEWVRDESGKATDYRRHWFSKRGQQVFPTEPNEEIYMIARAVIRGTQVAIVGLFQITDAVRTDDQSGPIIPVWAKSTDGVNWEFPFGRIPAFEQQYPGGMTLPNRLHIWGSELHCTYGEMNFSHNTFNQTPNPITEARKVAFDLKQTTEALGI